MKTASILLLVVLLSSCATKPYEVCDATCNRGEKPLSDDAEKVYYCILSEGKDQPEFCRELEK